MLKGFADFDEVLLVNGSVCDFSTLDVDVFVDWVFDFEEIAYCFV